MIRCKRRPTAADVREHMESIDSSRVLVVEDDEAIAALIRRTLSDAGLESDHAANGLDGLWMARENAYGAMLLDILMPGMNGYEVCRTLRDEGSVLPILMLTAKTGEYDETDGLDLGADDYLRKPFSTAVLVSRVRALLRRTPTVRQSEILERGSIVFDVNARSCRQNEHEVTLTTKEATLLEALLRSGDQPMSRDQLVRQVWGMDFDGDPNVVDVYLGYLRKKLGKERIENLRGVGFRVKA